MALRSRRALVLAHQFRSIVCQLAKDDCLPCGWASSQTEGCQGLTSAHDLRGLVKAILEFRIAVKLPPYGHNPVQDT
eukprot:2943057-Rhodomonas_salina.2